MSIASMAPQLLSGIGQTTTGMMQAGGEIFTQILNMIRQEAGAENVRQAGDEAIQRVQDLVLPSVDRMGDRIKQSAETIDPYYKKASQELAGGKNRALSALDKVLPQVQAEAEKTRTEFNNRVTGYAEDIKAETDATIGMLRTSTTERVGSTVGGIQQAARVSADQWAAEARQNGQLSEDEIKLGRERILQQSRSETSRVWGEAFTNLNNQVMTTRNTGTSLLGNLYSTATANAPEASIFNTLTGAYEFVYGKQADVEYGEGAAQSALTQAKYNAVNAANNQLIAYDQLRTGMLEWIVDLGLNTELQATATSLGFAWQMPNLVGLMAPGYQMIANAGASLTGSSGGGGQKGSASFTILGTGGGGGCIWVGHCVLTPNGEKRLGDIKADDVVLGSDYQYHRVVAIDIGYVPEEARVPWVCHAMRDGRVLFITADHDIEDKDEIAFSLPVSFKEGADLALEGCNGYIVGGVAVVSNIGKSAVAIQAAVIQNKVMGRAPLFC